MRAVLHPWMQHACSQRSPRPACSMHIHLHGCTACRHGRGGLFWAAHQRFYLQMLAAAKVGQCMHVDRIQLSRYFPDYILWLLPYLFECPTRNLNSG